MKGTENAYEGENRSLHMKERIGYGVGDFANNMMYTPVNSFFTYFLTNVAGTWRRCGWNHSSGLPSPGRRQRPDRWFPDGKDPQQTR